MSDEPEAHLRALPCWRGRVVLEPLPGGLSNAVFIARDQAGVWVARIGKNFPFHHVSRTREAHAARAADAAGVGPAVLYAGGGALVCRFIDGRPLAADTMRARIDDIVALLRLCHSEVGRRLRGEAGAFWVFHVLRDYIAALSEAGHPIAADLPRLARVADALEAAQIALPIVFGHHDLLPANLIDDGARLWLIDWEYAGFGTAMFDLANAADNSQCADPQADTLLEAYFARAPDFALARAFDAMRVASALREALWAMISDLRLDAPGADYAAYARVCLERFEAAHARYRERHS